MSRRLLSQFNKKASVSARLAGFLALLLPIAASAQTTAWLSAASGTWETGGDWSLGLPGSTSVVTIAATGGNYTITTGSAHTIDSLVLDSANATLTLDSNLTLTSSIVGVSTVTLGTLNLSSADIFVSQTTGLYAFPNLGTITSTGNSEIAGTGNGLTFANTGNVTVTSGTLTLGAGSHDVIANAGTMTANGGTLTFNGGGTSIANAGGTIEATNGGIVNFGGSFTSAGLAGTIEIVGSGTLNLTGSLANVTLPTPTGGMFTLDGGTITGGTVPSGSLTFNGSGGTLSGVSLTGAFTVPSNASFTATGGTQFSGGTTTFTGGNLVRLFGTGSDLVLASDAVWIGDVAMTGQSTGATVTNSGQLEANTNALIYGGGSTGFIFTNANGGVVSSTGAASTLTMGDGQNDAVVNQSGGTINANGGNITLGLNSGSVTNSGLIEATSSTSTLTIGTGTTTWTNTGTIEATGGGIVDLGGAFNEASLTAGTLEIVTSGTLNLTGTLTQLSTDTLEAPNHGGVFTLAGGTIAGGNVDNTTTPALTFSVAGGVLSNVSLSGTFTVPSNASFSASAGTQFATGTTTFSGGNLVRLSGTGSDLVLASDAIWTGDIAMTGQSVGASVTNGGQLIANTNALIYGGGSTGFIFTNANGGVVSNTGAASTLTIGDSQNDAVVNQSGGTINADGGNITLGLNSGSVTNSGLLEATSSASTLTIGTGATTWSNTGTIEATGGGIVDLGGAFNEASLTAGTIKIVTSGTMNLTGTLTQLSTDTLEAPNHGGIFTLAGGTIAGGNVDNTTTPALTFSVTGGVLSNVSLAGTFTVPSGTSFTAAAGTQFASGTTTFAGGNLVRLSGTGSDLVLASDAIWTGDIAMTGQSVGAAMTNNGQLIANTNALIYGGGSTGFSFTNASGGLVSNATSSTALSIGDGQNDAVVNQSGGTINADGGNITLGLNSGSVTNAGLIEATSPASTLTIGTGATTWSNTGTIEATGGGIVDLGGAFNEASLTAGTIKIVTSGTLNLTGTLTQLSTDTLEAPNHGGVFTLAGGTIAGGNVDNTTTPALTFSVTGGVLSNVSLGGTFTAPSGTSFTAAAGTQFASGTTTFVGGNLVRLSGTGSDLVLASDAIWTGDIAMTGQSVGASVTNGGQLIANTNALIYGGGSTGFSFTNASGGVVSSTGAGSTLTIGDGQNDAVANQSGGTINANGGNITLGLNSGSVTNAGLIEATSSASTLTIGSGATTWTNTGTIEATGGGIVDLGGVFNEASLTAGTIKIVTSGTLNFTGTLNQLSTDTLQAPNGGGIFTLAGGTIANGMVAGSALAFSSSGGTLSGVTMNGNFSVASGGGFTAAAGTQFSGGTTTFTGPDTVRISGSGTDLTLAGNATWAGEISITGLAASAGLVNAGILDESGSALIYGGGSTGFTFSNSGTIQETSGTLTIGDSATDAFTNTGTVEANGGNVTFALSGASVTNFSGTTLTGGTWVAGPSSVMTFTNPTNAIVTIAAGTTVELNGAGSEIESGPSSHTLETTLTTNDGTLEILGSRNFASTSAGITDNGTIQLGGGSLTASSFSAGSGAVLSGTGSFNPTGGVNLAGAIVSPGSASANNYVGSLTFNTLTLGLNGGYTFDIMNAGGTTAGTDYDTIHVTGAVTDGANGGSRFTVYVESVNPGTGLPGAAGGFNMAQSYQWTLVAAASVNSFNVSDFIVDTSAFTNGLAGGSFSLTSSGNDIFLNFTPVPEPSTWALMACGTALVGWLARRRRPRGALSR